MAGTRSLVKLYPRYPIRSVLSDKDGTDEVMWAKLVPPYAKITRLWGSLTYMATADMDLQDHAIGMTRIGIGPVSNEVDADGITAANVVDLLPYSADAELDGSEQANAGLLGSQELRGPWRHSFFKREHRWHYGNKNTPISGAGKLRASDSFRLDCKVPRSPMDEGQVIALMFRTDDPQDVIADNTDFDKMAGGGAGDLEALYKALAGAAPEYRTSEIPGELDEYGTVVKDWMTLGIQNMDAGDSVALDFNATGYITAEVVVYEPRASRYVTTRGGGY